MKNRRLFLSFIVLDTLIALGVLGWFLWTQAHPQPAPRFDGERALKDVTAQVAFGPRIPNSDAHAEVIKYIQSELANAGWESSVKEQQFGGKTALNILTTRNEEKPVILLGAHYDSRIHADNDPDPGNHTAPVPAANDVA